MHDHDTSNVSRRDFVKTAAVGLGGLSAATLPGAGIPDASAAQAAGRSAQAAGAHDTIVITLSPSGRSSLPGSPQTDTRDVNAHAAAALEGINAGAAIVHVRGGNLPGEGGPNLDNWRQLTELIRAKSNAIVNYGSSAMSPPVRKTLIALKPDAGSVLVGHHFGGTPMTFENQKQYIVDHLAAGVLPEIELFHSGDVANLNRLLETGLLRPPYCVTVFLNYNAYYRVPPTVQQLEAMLALLPPDAHWTLNVKGEKHFDMAAYAISRGGHVRTGLENDVAVGGKPAKSNAECVERIVQLARSMGREIASPADARQQLALPRKPEMVTARSARPFRT